ncbi:disulfide bond formation protein DsbA [Vibrio tubiashii]|uniref:disulfide bond formation protein DsbA n=1 Tax=Vibrio tubiashii TaxID=29498 RepID=UPI00234EBBB6|nr:disulfide bond formation protein DsbA [Vibrio tubiashii]WCP69875.1 disulfide bond formation protein DsbA [Vibrio tubiashii]
MKVSKQVKNTLCFYLLCIAVIFSVVAKHTSKAHAGSFEENVHYVTLDQQPTSEPQVKIFYTPFCRPCAIVHTPIRTMSERAGINFIDVPVDFGPLGKDIQASIATANRQEIGHDYVNELISSIHVRPSTAPRNREDLADLIERCGGDATDFRNGCEDVRADIENFDQLAKQYYINATPTIVVNGNKRINLGSLKSLPELELLLIELSGV